MHFNVSSFLRTSAEKCPERAAIHSLIGGKKLSASYQEVDALTDYYARKLEKRGFTKGCKTVVMVKMGVDFIALSFALFRIGAIPVLIDPGMGVKKMALCIQEVKPESFVGIPLAWLASKFFPTAFSSVRSSFILWSSSLESVKEQVKRKTAPAPFPLCNTDEGEVAAILFTSGSTGIAKGVIYTHAHFREQVRLIQKTYHIMPGEIDLAPFPLFALFDFAMETTVVIPNMDPTEQAKADPAKVVSAIQEQKVSSAFGSPTLWKKIIPYCKEKGIILHSLKRVLIAGAPVSVNLLEEFVEILPKDAEMHTPYGATEALPIASISATEVRKETGEATKNGAGICVGSPLKGVTIKIIAIKDEEITSYSPKLLLPEGKIGEIIVQGDVVTKEYYQRKSSTKMAKIMTNSKNFWHRMGDLGYFDKKGRLWFVGRKMHRVECEGGVKLFPIQIEALYNEHPKVERSALVGIGTIGKQKAVLFIEPVKGAFPKTDKQKENFRKELQERTANHPLTKHIQEIHFHPSFPVDVRHNAKIDRQCLRHTNM